MAMIGLEKIHSIAFTADHEFCPTRRWLALAPLFAALPLALSGSTASAAKIDPSETVITPPDAIKWTSWSGLPPHIGEMATLYGGLEQPGPYLVLMKWHPGFFSAPHFYATDRLSLVLSGTWWVNSGSDFDPDNTVPVPAGGFVRRVAHTPHYDGVKKPATEPAVIALFGLAPVQLMLVDPNTQRSHLAGELIARIFLRWSEAWREALAAALGAKALTCSLRSAVDRSRRSGPRRSL